MVHIAKLHEQFKLSVNRIDSNYNKSFSVSVVDAYLNKAQDVIMTRFMRYVESNTTVRNHLKVLENKEVVLGIIDTQDDHVVAAYPDDYYRLLRQNIYATSKDCNKPRKIMVHIVQSDDLSDSLSNPFWKPSFDWAETIGDEANNGLWVFKEKDWKVDKVVVDYMRKPKPMYAPSLVKGKQYITADGDLVTADMHCEFSDTYLWRYIADLASVFAMRDQGQVDDTKTKMEEMIFSEIVRI